MKTLTFFALAACISNPATAAEFVAAGPIQKIFALDPAGFGPDRSHILISGLASRRASR